MRFLEDHADSHGVATRLKRQCANFVCNNHAMENLKDSKPRGHRQGVGIVLSSKAGEVLVARRNDMENQWQFPQGGIDGGETPVEAMYREMQEELGIGKTHVSILAVTNKPMRYNFVESIVDANGLTRKYLGQELLFFLVEFLGCDGMIDVKGVEEPEFDCWSWVDYWKPVELIVDFKRAAYQQALSELEPFMNRKGTVIA